MRIRRFTTTLFFGVALLIAADARAEVFVVRGLAVGTFGTTAATPLFGIGLGVELGPIVQLNFEAAREFGRADPRVTPVPANPPGVPTQFEIVFIPIDGTRVDRRLMGGARFRLPSAHRLTLFGEVNGGLVRFTTRYEPGSFRDEGNIDTRSFVEAGGGISVRLAGRTSLEATYRIGQVVEEYNNDTAQSFGVGIAVGF